MKRKRNNTPLLTGFSAIDPIDPKSFTVVTKPKYKPVGDEDLYPTSPTPEDWGDEEVDDGLGSFSDFGDN